MRAVKIHRWGASGGHGSAERFLRTSAPPPDGERTQHGLTEGSETMGKDPAMPFYVNDWLSSPRVQSMTAAQELAYFRLCLFCWASGDASIPDDDDQLATISRMGKGWLKGGSKVVRKCFNQHPTKDAHLTNETVFRLWSERQAWREKSREGGVKSGEIRGKKSAKGGSRVVEPKGNLSSSSSSSISSSDGGNPHSPPARPPDPFEIWWQAVHSKAGKDSARRAYSKAVSRVRMSDESRDPHAYLLDRMTAFAASPAAHPTERTPIHPATWLNQGRFEDDPATWQHVGSARDPSDPRKTFETAQRYLKGAQP